MRVMSGIRATGRLHIGHYIGALKNCLKLQEDNECFWGIMDWHGLTTAYKMPESVTRWSRDIFIELLALGLTLDKCTLFIQSQIPEHLELFMNFANLTPLGWLERVPTWKDAQEEAIQTETRNLGRFAYPVLQAADIAIYRAQGVPVGADQVAHLELSREIIRRFNGLYGGPLVEPKALLTETPVLPGMDGRKMSKSYNNGIYLTEETTDLAQKIKAMPTDPQRVRRHDPGDPDKCGVYSYHKLFSQENEVKEVAEGCRTAGIGCGDCKSILIRNLESFCGGIRERKKELLNNPSQIDSMIKEGRLRARKEAQSTLEQVHHYMQGHQDTPP